MAHRFGHYNQTVGQNVTLDIASFGNHNFGTACSGPSADQAQIGSKKARQAIVTQPVERRELKNKPI